MGNNNLCKAKVKPFTVFELDDFTTDEHTLSALSDFREHYPTFKATLFTLIGKSDLSKLADLVKLDWLEVAVHGMDHTTERLWNYLEAKAFLRFAEELRLSQLYKMPWDDCPSDGFLQALSEAGFKLVTRRKEYILAITKYELPVYLGCPQSVWIHPFQLSYIVKPLIAPFYTVSDVFAMPEARFFEWVK